MADVIRKATNRWTKGLVMDFSPENTKNEVLTHALNATLLTFNGNELSLQNDMGNARVETAFLPEGYVPVGTCEYGGILYIVSYNPLENKSQIGCFPSPERNISNEELGCEEVVIQNSNFQSGSGDEMVLNTSYKVLLKQSDLNPGDKFLIHSNKDIIKNRLKDLVIKNGNEEQEVLNPIIALNIVSIDEKGRIVYLTNEVLRYKVTSENVSYEYHINANTDENNQLQDIDTYRNVLSSGYSVFKEKTSGKLAILAELITIDSYSVTHSVQKGDGGAFDVIIHTEVSPDLTNQTYDKDPKLSYYYLEDSKGYLQGNNLVYEMDQTNFMNTKLSDIYTSESDELKKNLDVTLTDSKAVFNFPKQKTYHWRGRVLNDENFDDNPLLTTEFKEMVYHRVSFSQLDLDYFINDLQANFYIFSKDSETYLPINFDLDLPTTALVILPKTTMVKYDKFQPKVDINYIEGYNTLIEVYPGEKPIKLYVVEQYLPTKPIENNDLGIYEDVKLASLKLPELVDNNNLTFPFKYDYTLVPCMEFGKLDYLKVSNSIDFSKLYLFDKSEFNVWKYRVDGNQLVLTIGASVYDTFETNKVDALVLEFYDTSGPVGLLEISGKKSYSGQFTKVLGLDEYRQLKKLCITNDGTYDYMDLSDGSEEDDRIGIIKSNTIYAIKPYFRVAEAQNSEKFTFIQKSPMILITLPVNNWAYSSVDNFNNISEIPLSMVLTYRMQDISNPKLIESEDESVIKYKTGTYEETDLNFKSTVNYIGDTQLQLAIGLHKDYEQFGLFSDVELDKVFKCTLQLDAIDGQKFGFRDQELELGPLSISDYNFLQKEEDKKDDPYIHIEYEFTISYDTYINDIRKTSIPATTVCALYHKQPDGIYNYSDFGLYEITNGDISCYLSDLVFYNSGSKSESIFGTARMAITDDQYMYFQCIPQRQFVQDTVPLSVAGRLNAGEPLRSVINSVGKLAFCQPHAHVLLEDSYKSNITYNNNGYQLNSEEGSCNNDIVTHPVYNMSANTIDMIDYQSKFISTVSYNTNSSIYNGLNQYELAKFNRLLLNSMSGIYAYNPDYSSFPIRVGSVSVSNPTQQFNSNLYCTYSNFNFGDKSLNDYLFLTKTINNNEVLTVSDYLTKLNEEVEGLPHIQFIPETTYCGSSEHAYLISQLTYNLEVPDELYRNLEFDFENGLFVMHSDGSWNFLEGSINKNTLYGFLSQNNKKKLIQLDVTTYNIDENGFVKIKDNAKDIINTETITITPSDEVSTQLSKSIELSFTDVDVDLYEDYDSKCDITWEIPNLEHKQKIDNWVYGFADLRTGNISKVSASYTIISKSKTSNMNVGVISQPKIEMVIVSNIPNSNSIVLQDIKDPNDLKWFFGEDPSGRNLTLNNGETITYFGNCSPGVNVESTQLQTGLKTQIVSNFDANTAVFAIIRCKVEDIDIKVSIYKNISDIEDTVIHVNKTTNYFRRNGNIYYNYYLDTCFQGSTITINDLIYRPEIDGHRLYMKDQYSPVTGAKIYYRQDKKIDDYGLNYINLFSGPCYTGLFVDEADPEFDMEKKFNSQ